MRLLGDRTRNQSTNHWEMFQLFAQNLDEIFWVMNPETEAITYVSPAFETICELPIEIIQSNPPFYWELIYTGDRQRVLEVSARLKDNGHFEEEFRIVCPSGRMKWIRVTGSKAEDSSGAFHYVGTCREITVRKEKEVQLRESEDLFRDMVEHSSDLICTHTLEGKLLSVNEMPARLLGYTREEVLAKPMREFLLPEFRPQFDQAMKDIVQTGVVTGHMVVLTKSGERRVWKYRNTLRTDLAHPIVRGIAHDVTEQKQIERALQQSEERYAKAFLASPYAIVISTIDEGTFVEVNDSFLRIMGFTREESVGRTSKELNLWVVPSDRESILNEVAEKGRVKSRQIVFRHKHGKHLIVNFTGELIELRGRKHLLSVYEDITERKCAELELQRLSGQLLKLQDQERRKIARDLHDTTGQELASIATTLDRLRDEVPRAKRKWRKLLADSAATARESLKEVRTLSYILHPPLLDEAGLQDAILHFAKGFSARTNVALQIEIAPDFGRVSEEIELALFKVVQESVTNVHRHSGSTNAKIELNRDETQIMLRILDTGHGMSSPKTQRRIANTLGVGIPSMEERVKQVGGRMDIRTSSVGTSVCVTVPL